MTKKEIMQELKAVGNGATLITIEQIMRFTGLSRTTIIGTFKNVDCVKVCRKNLYYIGDVADVLLKGAS